jgi:hypothetical protein
MKIVKILVALVFTLILLYVARTNSEGRPKYYTFEENGYTFEMTTVPKAPELGIAHIPIKITGKTEAGLVYRIRTSKFDQDADTDLRQYGNVPLTVSDSAAGLYYIDLSTGAKGGKLYYYFEIRDNTGGYRAGFTMPDGKPFMLKYIGAVPTWIVTTHILFMFATVFFVVLVSIQAVQVIRTSQGIRPMAILLLLATIATFIGCYPFGFPMNYYAFGTIWEGVPFGTDATDNKTQLIFLYLLMVTLLNAATLAKGKTDRGLYSPRVRGWLGAGSFVLMLAIYLIPHSIQFSTGLTKTVCWSFIGLLALVYVGGLITKGKLGRSGKAVGKEKKQKRT